MDNKEAVNWLINILEDIGKAEHSDLWHYEQALTEIKDMLESAQLSQDGITKGTTSDTISRQAVVDVLKRFKPELIPYETARSYVEKTIDTMYDRIVELPTIQPEQHEGHWILYDKRFPWRFYYKCSECGNYLDFSGVNAGRGEANYCPNCGAKMEEKQYE